jgi:hypothetical protein
MIVLKYVKIEIRVVGMIRIKRACAANWSDT